MQARKIFAMVMLVALVTALCAQTVYAAEKRVRLVVPGCI